MANEKQQPQGPAGRPSVSEAAAEHHREMSGGAPEGTWTDTPEDLEDREERVVVFSKEELANMPDVKSSDLGDAKTVKDAPTGREMTDAA